MRTLVTGAAGFVGRAVTGRLLATQAAGAELVLADRVPFEVAAAGVEARVGDLSDHAFLENLTIGVDHVVHLAALPGGASELDYAASLRVNLDASLALIERLAAAPAARPVRFVYASSIAVFGAPLPSQIDDQTPPRPSLTYGAHKLMVETAIANLTRLRRIDGIALRLPGLVARPRAAGGLKSAFMSDVFHAMAAGERYTLPVSADATVWILSVAAAAEALVHALEMPAPPPATPIAMTLPALRISMERLVQAIALATGGSTTLVGYAPDEDLQAQFGRSPPLSTALADALGFRHDGDVERLVRRALAGLETNAS